MRTPDHWAWAASIRSATPARSGIVSRANELWGANPIAHITTNTEKLMRGKFVTICAIMRNPHGCHTACGDANSMTRSICATDGGGRDAGPHTLAIDDDARCSVSAVGGAARGGATKRIVYASRT